LNIKKLWPDFVGLVSQWYRASLKQNMDARISFRKHTVGDLRATVAQTQEDIKRKTEEKLQQIVARESELMLLQRDAFQEMELRNILGQRQALLRSRDAEVNFTSRPERP
jgi:hypothetical protein